MAGDKVVVDHAHRLHERVDGRWANEAKPFGFQCLRNAFRDIGLRWDISGLGVFVDDRLSVADSPKEIRQALSAA